MKPQRIQRRRTKGWKMPENTVYVGRPSVFGNEHDYRKLGREKAVTLFREQMEKHMKANTYLAEKIRMLRGKNLACWCPIKYACHADVLLQLANRDEPTA